VSHPCYAERASNSIVATGYPFFFLHYDLKKYLSTSTFKKTTPLQVLKRPLHFNFFKNHSTSTLKKRQLHFNLKYLSTTIFKRSIRLK